MNAVVSWLSLEALAEGEAANLEVSSAGRPVAPVVFLDLDHIRPNARLTAATAAAAAAQRVLIGVAQKPVEPFLSPVLDALAFTLVPLGEEAESSDRVGVADPLETAAAVAAYSGVSPRAAVTLTGLLRLTEQLPVRDGLVAESLAYSMLLAGPEFSEWRARTPRRPHVDVEEAAVQLDREGPLLRVALNRPRRHNAFSRDVRDGLVEALELAYIDHTITRVELAGRGASFCSGGDLDEFGTTPDVSAAHLIRLRQSAGHAVYRCAERVQVRVHGACIGAGIEIPAFANRVEAQPDAYFQLPELRMGLVPGAGGTVSVTRRIGRWRTAYLVLSGAPVDARTALRWGLVDACADL
ncbi:enoyl-CoA hydratase/isomerase family protein [Streptomyces sp. NPDC051572]|uniref:enoyl-CoA hydratase/isomerase family protein n=1 Tax=unclassified Streptomyces TaxID=2593676 RepID=UPI00344DF75A